jgi:hypothetical protein
VRVRSILILALVAAAMLLALPAAQAKSYSFARLRTDITIEPDGSFTVRETRTFDFVGTFHFGYLSIPDGSYDLRAITVSDGDLPLERAEPGGERRGTYGGGGGGGAG